MLATQGNGGCMTEKVRKSEEERDAEVKKMLEDWDIVKCKFCGKKISMLNAKLIHGEETEYFVCKTHN